MPGDNTVMNGSTGVAALTRVGPGAAGRAHRQGVTVRAVLIGLVLTPLNVFFLVHAIWSVGGFTGAESLFTNCVGALFLFALLNLWLKQRRSVWTFAPGELLTVYVVLGIGTGLVCSVWDLGGSLVVTVTYPFWFATDSNNWKTLLWPNLPPWLTVQDRSLLEGFYVGGSTGYTWSVIRGWAPAAFWWAAIMGVAMWVCLCLNAIVRRCWQDEERLPFPMTVLPVELTEERAALLHNRLFWMAVAITTGTGVWNTLCGLMPSLPAIRFSYDYIAWVQNRRPWNFIRYTGLECSPWSIGLCYIMPLDMAFSLFVFDLLWTAEYIAVGQFGWATSPWGGFPYGEQQTAGGFLAVLVTILWLDRDYLVQYLRRAVGLKSALSETASEEAFSPTVAVCGALAGLAFLWWFFWRAGMPHWVILAFFVIYFSMSLVISRLRAQIGPPTHQLYGAMPNWVLSSFAGPRTLGARTLGMFMAFRPFLQEQRNNPTPIQMEAFKMAEGGRMQRRRIAIVVAVAVPLAMLSYFWANIHLGYAIGLGSGKAHPWQVRIGGWATEELEVGLRTPGEPGSSGMIAVGAGALITLVLAYLKLRFQWWPLHPIAFPLAPASTIQSMTLVIFGIWLFKSILLRYGGPKAHLKALPFFLGLLVGSGTIALLQRLLFAALGVRL